MVADGPVEALAADRQALLALGRRLSGEHWALPSGCAGWSLQDVVSHLSALFWLLVDPSMVPDAGGRDSESAQEFYMQHRRGRRPDEVLEEYETVSARALPLLGGFVGAHFEVPLGDVGTYPADLVPCAFCFDHYTHIRTDLFGPRGPLADVPPPSDALRVVPVLRWIEAALPQQNGPILDSFDRPVLVRVTGPAPWTFHLGPPGDPALDVSCGPLEFVLAVTGRGTWRTAAPEGVDVVEAFGRLGQLHVF